MFNVLASLAGAAVTASGANKQAKATQKANDQQMALERENLAYSKERDEADRALLAKYNDEAVAREKYLTQIMLEGYTDPVTGVTSKYVPGQGWVTSYSGEARDQLQAERSESMKQLTEDAPRARRGRETNEVRRGQESQYAEGVLNEMKGPDPYNKDRIIADLINARRRGVNEGFDKSQSQVLTSDIRTGTSSNKFLAEAARERASALSDADAGAYTEGLSLAEDLKGARTSRLGNSYNSMAQRASNVDDASFAPSGLGEIAANLAGRNNPSSANQNKVNPTTGRAPAQFDTSIVKPNLLGATQAYTLGQGISNLGKLTLPTPTASSGPQLPWLTSGQRTSGNQSY